LKLFSDHFGCLCSMCDKPCKTLSPFCSEKCKQKYNKQYAKIIQWDKDHPNPTWDQCDERQKIAEECKTNV